METKPTTKRKNIIRELNEYFLIPELVCQHVLQRDGEKCWRYLTTDALECLLIIRRDILKVPCTINTRTCTQRGYRCNLCDLVQAKSRKSQLYATPHFGQAFDVIPKGMAAEDARKQIEQNADLLPCNIRLEKDVSWVHFDTYDNGNAKTKVTYFKG